MDSALPKLSLEHSALLFLDMQNEFLNPDGVFNRNGLIPPMTAADRQTLVLNSTILSQTMRETGRPIVYLKTVYRPDYKDCFLSPLWQSCLGQKRSALAKGSTGAAIIEELEPQVRDFVLTKKGHSAFQHTYLDRLLASWGIDTCIVAGNLHGSAHETFAQGGALGYDFVLAADACYPLHSPHLETFKNQALTLKVAEILVDSSMQTKNPERPIHKPALLMVDLQNDSVHEQGANHRLGFSNIKAEEKSEVIRNNQQLATAMREREFPVIYVKLIKKVRGKSAYVDTATSKLSLRAHPISERIERGAEGTWGAEFLDELQPRDGDFVVSKRSQSAFGTTHLHRLLRNLGVNLIIATGGSVMACLASTVREGVGLGYRVIVASDATYPANKRSIGLPVLASRAEINATGEILTKLAQCGW